MLLKKLSRVQVHYLSSPFITNFNLVEIEIPSFLQKRIISKQILPRFLKVQNAAFMGVQIPAETKFVKSSLRPVCVQWLRWPIEDIPRFFLVCLFVSLSYRAINEKFIAQ